MISKTIGYNGLHNIFRHTHMSWFGAWSIWWFGWLDDAEELHETSWNFAARPTFRIISEDINEQRMNSTTSCFTCHDIHHSSLHHCTELKNHTGVAIVHRADGEVQHVAPPVESLESDLNLMWVRINVRERQAAKARLVFPWFVFHFHIFHAVVCSGRRSNMSLIQCYCDHVILARGSWEARDEALRAGSHSIDPSSSNSLRGIHLRHRPKACSQNVFGIRSRFVPFQFLELQGFHRFP